MNNFLSPRFFVVIHVQAMRNDKAALVHLLKETEKCAMAEVSGVFLIPDYENERNGYSLRATSEDLIFYYLQVKKHFPSLKTGINFLKKINSLDEDFQKRIKNINFEMIQTDSSFLDLEDFSGGRQTELFVALAFKYSKYEKATGKELEALCNAIPRKENIIPTTSGSATGNEANLEKITEIRKYISRDIRLGIASGINLQNAATFLNLGVTDFLVATSLIVSKEHGFDILSKSRMLDLKRIILG